MHFMNLWVNGNKLYSKTLWVVIKTEKLDINHLTFTKKPADTTHLQMTKEQEAQSPRGT